MDLAAAWKSFQGTVRDAQEAIHILHGHFQESTGRSIRGIVGSESLPSVWEQTHPLDRNDKKELLSLLAKLESSLSDQNTSTILKGLRPILPPADKVESDIGPCLDRLRSVVRGFADDLIRDAADGDLCFRVCPRYLRLHEALDPLTLLEDGYATSRMLEQAGELATDRTKHKAGTLPTESCKINLKRWGIGRDADCWWLFRLCKDGRRAKWESRGRIDVPSGNPGPIRRKASIFCSHASDEQATRRCSNGVVPRGTRRRCSRSAPVRQKRKSVGIASRVWICRQG